ncbi:MAG: hypothetical protein PHC98_01890 [Syntrophotalea acetylenica]|nr:hypothetical protein [Syntrophotalea acetylenica]
MNVPVICQVCGERIATVDPEKVSYPMSGAMFGSPDRIHGVPAPFDPSLDWEAIRCPYGRIHRPFFVDNEILTSAGVIVLPTDGAKPFLQDVPVEFGRESICDRALQQSDDEAERKAREAINGETEEGAGEQDDNQPVEEAQEKKTIKAKRKRR